MVIYGSWSLYNRVGQVQLGPGVMAYSVPQQESIDPPVRHRFNQYDITQLATFAIKAKVLGKTNHAFPILTNKKKSNNRILYWCSFATLFNRIDYNILIIAFILLICS